MEDRLAELRNLGGVKPEPEKKGKKGKKGKDEDNNNNNNNNEGTTSSGEPSINDIEMGPLDGEPDEEFMPEFYREVGIIKTMMSSIRRAMVTFEEKSIQSLNSVLGDNTKAEQDLQTTLSNTNKAFQELKSNLENMKINTDKYIASGQSKNDTENKIRQNMHKTLTQKFVEMMREYQELQTNYKNKYKEKIFHRYKIANKEATDEEINQAIESGNANAVFAETVLYSHLTREAQTALAYIQDRHNDIVKLAQSIAELHQLFIDMAVLVETQGEILNQIEANVESTVLNVKEGVENLAEANRLHRKSRKKMYILLVIVVIVLIAVLAPVLSTQIPKSSK